MIEKRDIYISCFDTMRTLHIYLPEDYEHSRKKYPVLYMYDGHNLFFDEDATYGKSWGLKDYLDSHHIPLIVIGIECNHEGNMRLSEFSPYDFNDFYLGEIHGRGSELMDWVVGELKPWVDSNYRTLSKRKYTAIAGSSMGGLMALYTILHHNQTFSKAACLSSYLHGVMPDIKKELKNRMSKETKVYISWGSDEFRTKAQLASGTDRNLYITRELLKKGVDVYPNLVVRGKHCEACWEKEVKIFLPYLFK